MKKNILFIIILLYFLISFFYSTVADNNNILIYKNNEQRTGFFDTAGVPILHGIKWKVTLDGTAGTPDLYEGVLIFSTNKYVLYSIDSKTGKEISWKLYEDYSPLILYNDIIIAVQRIFRDNKPILIGLDYKTKSKIWENNIIQSVYSFLLHKDILYIVNRIEGKEEGDIYLIYLVNPETGEILEEIEPNTSIRGIAFWKDNLIFTARDGLYMIDFSVSNKKHIPVKIFETRKETILHENQKYAKNNRTETIPCISNDCVYFGDYIGNFFALDLKTKKVKWERKFDNSFYIFDSPSIYDGIIYLYNNGGIYYLNEKDGSIIYKKENIDATNAIAITRDGIYFATDDGILYALDRKTGKEQWSIKLAKRCMSMPIVSNGVIYISAFDTLEKGYMFAIY